MAKFIINKFQDDFYFLKLFNSEVMEEYYDNLQFLIEHTFNLTNRRVFLLGHSMGNIVINRFLRLDKITPVQKFNREINIFLKFSGMAKAAFTGHNQRGCPLWRRHKNDANDVFRYIECCT
jgi:hypothetical protein